MTSSDDTEVVINGAHTPVVLTDAGPTPAPGELTSFEQRLGYELPGDYREFLARYNGGTTVVGAVTGRDDEPDVPYRHGDAVGSFLKLPVDGADIPDYAQLRIPREQDLALPPDALVIATDDGGNAFVLSLGERRGEIRFVVLDEIDEPFESHRVMAETFLDFLQRFRSIEEQRTLDEAERAAEGEAIRNGPLPPGVEVQCRRVERDYPSIREWIRRAFLAVFEDKGFFAVHDDERSRDVLDLVALLAVSTDYSRGIAREDLEPLLSGAWSATRGGLGFTGYAEDFLESWWRDRLDAGLLVMEGTRARLSAAGGAAWAARLAQKV
jgi:hypothetical protein